MVFGGRTGQRPRFAAELTTRISRRDITLSPTVWWAARGVFVSYALGAPIAFAAFEHLRTPRMAAFACVVTLVTIAFLRSPPPRPGTRGPHLALLAISFTGGFAVVAFSPTSALVICGLLYAGPLASVWLERRSHIVAHSAIAAACLIVPPLLGYGDQATLVAALWLGPATIAVAWCNTIVLEAVEAQGAELEHLTRRDPLTGLGNRRLLDDNLAIELVRHRAERHPLAMLLLDLRGFKALNDTHGHAAGDDALRHVAEVLRRQFSPPSILTRPGGDEFAILLPETDLAAAHAAIPALRAALHEHTGLDAAVGAAAFPRDAADAPGLTAVADARMLAKKAARRPGHTVAPAPASVPRPSTDAAPTPIGRTGREFLATTPELWRATGAVMLATGLMGVALVATTSGIVSNAFLGVTLLGAAVGAWCLASPPAPIGSRRNHAVVASSYLLTGLTLATTTGPPIAAGLAIWIGPLVALRLTDRRALTIHLAAASVALLAGGAAAAEQPISMAGAVFLLTGTLVLAGCSMFVFETSERQGAELDAALRRDPLTGIGNRRALAERFDALGAGTPAALLALDLDGFKGVNDTLGHAAGDEVLCAVARALTSIVGHRGEVFRHGGDEFTALLPHASEADARRVAADIRIHLHRFSVSRVTVSTGVGVAARPHSGHTLADLLEHADALLRHDKYGTPSLIPAVGAAVSPALQSERR